MDYDNLRWKPLLNQQFSNFLIDRTGISFNYHPILVLEMDEKLLFIKAQGAKYQNINGKIQLKKTQQDLIQKKRAVLINQTEKHLVNNEEVQPLFRKDSLVDTSQVFIISKKDFERYYDPSQDNVLYNTKSLDPQDRTKILDQVINNFGNRHITVTEISYAKNGLIDKKQIYVNEEDYLEEFRNNFNNADSINKSYIRHMMQEYHENYLVYKEQTSLENINGYLGNALEVFEKEYQIACLCENRVYEENDANYYYDIAQDFELKISDQEIEDWSDKACEQSFKKITLSNYEQDYYYQHPKAKQEDFPDIKEEFKTYCAKLKLEQIQEKLNQKENEAFRIQQNDLSNKCFDLSHQYDLNEFRNLNDQERKAFFKKVKETTKAIDQFTKQNTQETTLK